MLQLQLKTASALALHLLGSIHNPQDVIQIIVEKCVNPDTRRPYTFGEPSSRMDSSADSASCRCRLMLPLTASPCNALRLSQRSLTHASFPRAGVLERAVRGLHFNVDPKRSAKQQALELIPKLQEQFPIARAAMRFKVQARAGRESRRGTRHRAVAGASSVRLGRRLFSATTIHLASLLRRPRRR